MISITTNKSIRLCAAVAAVSLLLTGGITSANAQQGYEQGQQFQQQQQQMNVSDAQLQKFMEAENAAREVQESMAPQGQQPSQEDIQKMQQQMVQAIEGSGLSVQKYQEILSAIQTDESLRQKYMQMAR